jgi:putative toxin-antitoxin system antitoxin component (TIGR02293 family)
MKKYKIEEKDHPHNIVAEPIAMYNTIDDSSVYSLINAVRNGIRFSKFKSLFHVSTFTLTEWAKYLHISERTLQRYETENKTFDPSQSEKILQISMLYTFGKDVFGTEQVFDAWLHTKSLALGGIAPKELLDSSFGIELVKDELGRLQQGVLA